MTRMVGASAGRNDVRGISAYFFASLSISVATYGAVSATLFVMPSGFMGLTKGELVFAGALILVGYGSWGSILSTLFTSTLRTKVNALASITPSVMRVVMGVLLLYFGMGFAGVIASYMVSDIIMEAILALKCREALVAQRPGLNHAKELLVASLPSYLPSLLGVAGSWLGVLGIYGLVGSGETGTYYIAFIMASFVYGIPTMLLGLMFPVLSGMMDGRKRATQRSVRFTYALTAPIAALGRGTRGSSGGCWARLTWRLR